MSAQRTPRRPPCGSTRCCSACRQPSPCRLRHRLSRNRRVSTCARSRRPRPKPVLWRVRLPKRKPCRLLRPQSPAWPSRSRRLRLHLRRRNASSVRRHQLRSQRPARQSACRRRRPRRGQDQAFQARRAPRLCRALRRHRHHARRRNLSPLHRNPLYRSRSRSPAPHRRLARPPRLRRRCVSIRPCWACRPRLLPHKQPGPRRLIRLRCVQKRAPPRRPGLGRKRWPPLRAQRFRPSRRNPGTAAPGIRRPRPTTRGIGSSTCPCTRITCAASTPRSRSTPTRKRLTGSASARGSTTRRATGKAFTAWPSRIRTSSRCTCSATAGRASGTLPKTPASASAIPPACCRGPTSTITCPSRTSCRSRPSVTRTSASKGPSSRAGRATATSSSSGPNGSSASRARRSVLRRPSPSRRCNLPRRASAPQFRSRSECRMAPRWRSPPLRARRRTARAARSRAWLPVRLRALVPGWRPGRSRRSCRRPVVATRFMFPIRRRPWPCVRPKA